MAGDSGGVAGFGGRPWYAANEVVAFLLELAALGSVGWWGFGAGHEGALRVLLGGGAAALYGVGHPAAAGVMAVVTVVNTALAEVFRASPSAVAPAQARPSTPAQHAKPGDQE
ncbi:DUF2568 domain-containing protein [Streptomyces sp. N2A]|uniref:DUF2568 domain-containing protein n=1 Tax=Streptomyces sp. N2A TaxID=3073936 RepID=UPI0028704EEB|nr:DUF2568 domain-containing protein [Streptomyces sp. N2A]